MIGAGYGLRTQDQLDVLAKPALGTFGMEEFATTMKSLRVVQWHATEDSIDSQNWLKTLTAPHRLYTSSGNGHEYDWNRGQFISEFVASVDWILHPGLAEKTAPVRTGAKP